MRPLSGQTYDGRRHLLMSTLPPGVPPPPPPGAYPPPPPPSGGYPPPPGGAAPALAPLPWEDRPRIGFADALVDTIKLFLTRPTEAWSRTREKGDLGQPLLFAICVGWIGVAFNSIYGLLFGQMWLRFLPLDLKDRIGPMMGRMFGVTVGVTVFKIIMAPLFVLLGLFIGGAILHVSFLIVGALTNSTAGFEGTIRIVGYSWVAQLAHVIPLFGGLLAFVASLILSVMGAQALHRSSQGKAVVGVLLPIILCCGCILIGLIFGGAALLSGFRSH
jgi:hypothetical protein